LELRAVFAIAKILSNRRQGFEMSNSIHHPDECAGIRGNIYQRFAVGYIEGDPVHGVYSSKV
jgi:hypothetical protein